ncbi:MAG TPA: hypothetical protein VF808_18490 [Ktedonobacterales bacterium]
MSLHLAPTSVLPPAAVPSDGERHSYRRLRGRWPLVMRVVWLVSLALTLAVTLASFPQYLAQLRTPCAPGNCQFQQLTPAYIAALREIGVTQGAYMAITVALALIALALCWTLSAVIIWRRPGDWMASLVALMFLPLGTFLIAFDFSQQGWRFPQPIIVMTTVLLIMIDINFCLFPSGRFEPRWSRWVLVALVGLAVGSRWLNATPVDPDVVSLVTGPILGSASSIVLGMAQVVRYRAYSTPAQRQQTKWIIIGLTANGILLALSLTFVTLAPTRIAASGFVALWMYEGGFPLPFFLALGFAFGILRYRLWEIDHLINRALVYGALTLILTGLYAGLVIGLQTLARGYIDQGNSLVIVLSTLVIATLVLPLRRGLQAVIDRAFYRSQYDSARTLHAFSDALRHEIRVEALREQLLRAVDETMRPAHASLWLRPAPEGERSPAARATGGPGAAEYRSYPNGE